MNKYRCPSPISGRIIEIGAARGAYVREGQLVAKIQSAQQHVNVSLSAELVEQLSSIEFHTQQRSGSGSPTAISRGCGPSIALAAVEVAPNCNLDGSRCVRLSIPAGCDLVVGQTLRVQVSTKP